MKKKELWINQKSTIVILLITNTLTAFVAVVAIAALVKVSMNRVIKIEIPPYSYTPITVGAENYIEWWGKYFIDKVSDVSPGSFMRTIEDLCLYASSDGEKNLRAKGIQMEPEIKKNNIYQSFHPEYGTFKTKLLEGKKWRVQVDGNVVLNYGNLKPEIKKCTYWVDVTFRDKIYLEDFGYATK